MYHDDILACCQGAGFQSVEYMTGILKAMEEFDMVPGRAMTSSGSSLTMSLYYSKGLEWIENVIRTHQPTDYIDFKPWKLAKEVVSMANYFIDNVKIQTLLEENMTAEATKRQSVGVTRLRDFKNFMVPATPGTVLASTAIEGVFKPVLLNKELFGDSGLMNNIPTPPIQQVKNWKHIFIIVSPEPKFNNDPKDSFTKYLSNLFTAITYREVHQMKESGILDMENVTLIQPEEELGSGLLNWSPNYQFMDACYEQTKEILKNVEI